MAAATIIIPTTGDRGPVLDVAIRSVLRQTLADFELFVLGDGVHDVTKATVRAWCERDARIRFVDRAKHVRRGEPYRHELLMSEATGRFVAYLCDRDLWLDDHLAELDALLEQHDIAATARTKARDDGGFEVQPRLTLDTIASRRRWLRPEHVSPLSMVGHTLEAYRRLPHGWRETPPRYKSDSFMWHQWLDQPWVRATSSPVPTVVYLERGAHPGLSTVERCELSQRWLDRLSAPHGQRDVRRGMLAAIRDDWVRVGTRTPTAIRQEFVERPAREVRRTIRYRTG